MLARNFLVIGISNRLTCRKIRLFLSEPSHAMPCQSVPSRAASVHSTAYGQESIESITEWVEEGKPIREFLVPATLVNSYGPPEITEE